MEKNAKKYILAVIYFKEFNLFKKMNKNNIYSYFNISVTHKHYNLLDFYSTFLFIRKLNL